MHPCEALKLESDDAEGAVRAVLEAIRHVCAWRPDVDFALQLIEPYQPYGYYRSMSPVGSDTIVSQVCGVSGDCHMLRGEMELAAAWYELSVRRRKDTGFPQTYARLVVNCKLQSHIRPALDALRECRAAWIRRPWLERTRDTLTAFIRVNRCHPGWIRRQIQDRRLLAELEQLGLTIDDASH